MISLPWALGAWTGCSGGGLSFTVGDGQKTGCSEDYSCSPDEDGWTSDSSHNAAYAFEDWCWACQENPIDVPFYIDAGVVASPSDWERRMYGAPALSDVEDAFAVAETKWDVGADMDIRFSTASRLFADYGADDGVNSFWPRQGPYATGRDNADVLMTTNCHEPDKKAGPTNCDIAVYSEYEDAIGAVVPVRWQFGSANPGGDEFSAWFAFLHELGHVLGVDHNSIGDSVMNEGMRVGETKTPSADDIEAIIWLYGYSFGACG
jgi:hypothetical protein